MACNVSEDKRTGLGFLNPDLNAYGGFGAIVTPDELRYNYCFGNPLVAPNGQTITDETLWWYAWNGIGTVERDLNVDLVRKRRRYRPWIFGQDRTYDGKAWENSEAKIIGTNDFASPVLFNQDANFRISVNGGDAANITISSVLGPPFTRTADQLRDEINNQFISLNIGAIASVVISNGKQYVKIASKNKITTSDKASRLVFTKPPTSPTLDDCTGVIFGLDITDPAYQYSYEGWKENIDFFWEEPYDFNRKNFNEYIYIKMRGRPYTKIYACEFRDIAGGKVADILSWAKPNYNKGSIEFFPHTGALASLPLYAGASFPLANAYQAISNYPDAFFFDYDSGFENVLQLNQRWPEVINIVGIMAAMQLLNDLGEGKASAIASASIGLASISESYTTTMSAENTLFGAKLYTWIRELKRFYKDNKNKYSGFLIGSV